MDIHYNAFISYRHHPDDIRVAAEIHRSLEHYKVPKAIRKKSKGITRLFRDKEELPITSNLTDDITRALENSDYLIVICSTHTKESTWVQREIETFLKTHDRSKVLTVLVNGEPYDTIPEILLSEEKTDPVTGETVTVPIEPLSCDWRMKHRIAKREELPRLAAALLNCGYNELRQRERQYRTRRMIAAFSTALAISLCFMGYFIYSNTQIQQANERLQDANIQIQNNYDQALENQSMFLANASAELLDDGDRLTAIALALEALPEYEGERPYVAAAEAALANAVGIYRVEEEYVAVGSIECDALISDLDVTDDGRHIYVLDERNVLSVWDTETIQKRSALNLDFEPDQMMQTASGNMLTFDSYDERLVCSTPEGTIVWSESGYHDAALLNERSILMVMKSERTDFFAPYLNTIHFLDPDTGKEVRDPLQFSLTADDPGLPSFLSDSYPDVTTIGLKSIHEFADYHISTVDLNTGACTSPILLSDCYISCSGYTNEGNPLVAATSEIAFSNGYMADAVFITPAPVRILCLDRRNGQILWEAETISHTTGLCNTLEPIPNTSSIMCQIDDTLCVLDSATGEILRQNKANAGPIWTEVQEEHTRIMLRDGTMGIYRYDDNFFGVIKYMPDELNFGEVDINNTAYINESLDSRIVLYRYERDENWKHFSNFTGNSSMRSCTSFDDLLAVETYTMLSMFNTETQELLWKDGEEGDYAFNTEILGFSNDGKTLWCIYSDSELVAYDAHTGSSRRLPLPEWIDDLLISHSGQYYLRGQELFYCVKSYDPNQKYLIRMNLQTEKTDYWPICAEAETSGWASQETVVLTATDDHALIWEFTNAAIYEVDLHTGAVRTLMNDIASRPTSEPYGDGQYLLSCGNEIQLRSWAADASLRIDLGAQKAGALCVHGDQILALCDDGYLYWYEADGTYLSRTSLHRYSSFYSNIESDPSGLTWTFTDDGNLILNLFGLANIIDCGTRENRTYISNFVAYAPNQDDIILQSENIDNLGFCAYDRYTLAELTAKAKEVLGSFELTEEQKSAYGLLEE